MFQALNPTEPWQTWMLRALTCLISVNSRELSAYLRMECNYFTCSVELVLPPLVTHYAGSILANTRHGSIHHARTLNRSLAIQHYGLHKDVMVPDAFVLGCEVLCLLPALTISPSVTNTTMILLKTSSLTWRGGEVGYSYKLSL